jgi:ubiquinone/menaquinone biosynthesis C-methylase UbiE
MNTSAIRAAYDRWAAQYDTDENATRDLNARVLREQTFLRPDDVVLELGCGTGLNTAGLARQAGRVVAVDVSTKMLGRARRRLADAPVTLRQMDVTEPWPFDDGAFDAVVATLVLEHVERLAPVFREAHRVLRTGGTFYLGELHPYRQLGGTQANFEHEDSGERVVIEAFAHPTSAFVNTGIDAGFTVRRMGEWRGPDDEAPRLLSIRFRA